MTLTEEIRRAYDDAGEAWSAGPAPVYRALAQPVLDAAGDVSGLRVLDLGAGSGGLSEELVRRGARAIALDLSLGMLRRGASQRPPAVVADVRALPVRTACADLVTASFVLNHLEDPDPALREVARALRPGGRVLATTFDSDAPHPAKTVLDQVAVGHGYVEPAWYASAKSGFMPLLGSPERFAAAAAQTGLSDVHVEQVPVRLALPPARLAAWRLGMPHLAPFVAALRPAARAALVADAQQAVAGLTEPVLVGVLLLRARA